MPRRFSRRRSFAAKAISRRKFNWLNGITTLAESNVAPGAQTNVIMLSSQIAVDQSKLTIERLVGEIWTGFIGTPDQDLGVDTEVAIGMLLYTRPQDPAGTNVTTLDPWISQDRTSHRILWSRYDYIHVVGLGTGLGWADTGIQGGQPPHVDVKVKRIVDTSDTELVLSVAVPSVSDLSCYFFDNLRLLVKEP